VLPPNTGFPKGASDGLEGLTPGSTSPTGPSDEWVVKPVECGTGRRKSY
jgi:hypothetical protein